MGLAYFFLLSPIEARIGARRAEHASIQREIAESRRIVADLGRFKAEVAELEKKVDVIKDKLPTEKEMPALYRTLSDAAFQSGLGVGLFQPKEPRVSDYFTEIPITVAAEAGYHQYGQFFERIAGIPRVVNIIDWKLSRLPEGGLFAHQGGSDARHLHVPSGRIGSRAQAWAARWAPGRTTSEVTT